jgi:hypothetical protein
MCGRGTQTAASMQAALVALLLLALPVRAEQWGDIEPSIISLQEILKHHRTLAPSRRAFYEALLTHRDVVAVRVNYLPALSCGS